MNCIRLLRIFATTFLVLLFGLGFGCLPLSSAWAREICTPEMNKRAETLLADARKDWHSLLKHQRNFASCDDGELGESYSDAVVYLFVQRWDKFDIFVSLAKKHPAFERWAVQHIDATASSEDLNGIITNASTCGDETAAVSLCKSIRQAAEKALRESIHTVSP